MKSWGCRNLFPSSSSCPKMDGGALRFYGSSRYSTSSRTGPTKTPGQLSLWTREPVSISPPQRDAAFLTFIPWSSGTAMEDSLTCSPATFSQVFGRQGQLMQASE
ncbi:hypothetical protein DPEC_G00205560 [Dallia pectoralis]|uniref:Uncharacterized protein n=1 Tax=Dallia pectoralis TaxID=75939 RepID=A0ACC2G439_DALPE|nr:hypothetical protein DPEC_G00205560 [Dallia pectoralis]